jgi:hypothetical protein
MMAALLWARPIFEAILLALVGVYVWTAYVADAKQRPGATQEPSKSRREDKK